MDHDEVAITITFSRVWSYDICVYKELISTNAECTQDIDLQDKMVNMKDINSRNKFKKCKTPLNLNTWLKPIQMRNVSTPSGNIEQYINGNKCICDKMLQN